MVVSSLACGKIFNSVQCKDCSLMLVIHRSCPTDLPVLTATRPLGTGGGGGGGGYVNKTSAGFPFGCRELEAAIDCLPLSTCQYEANLDTIQTTQYWKLLQKTGWHMHVFQAR